ncbi:putative beta-glucosidase H [Aspergillus sclerotiicarbonarius CBS 121057]|uniref:Probable beta-glucosidase H n=1 Tax=Aspergillus sclerotiicarbonarius (strain CBS 121057 / IBT 28362) TaxID=1448318 RepID=A0A319E5R3_ASPSB|nr:putative beta-glucosidase H [Aspergillus sclerotiicarbonarius CBS 121057]
MSDIENTISKLSLHEKISLLSGCDFWHTTALPHHKIRSIRFSDGPNGIRGTRFFAGVPAACIPCGTALGATWGKELLYQAGELLGKECIAKGAHARLGPTINIQRSPLGGRGFESYSEDPYLSGALASCSIRGCQSTGVQAVVKHFVCNDQENERRAVDTLVTPRALREIYARPFQIAARDAEPAGLMTAYNKDNGCHVSESRELLQEMIREEWGWDPLMVSDWFGTYSSEKAITAGLDLEMPGKTRYRGSLIEFAVASRLITEATINKSVRRVLKFVERARQLEVADEEGSRDCPEDRKLLRQLAANGAVLLKNEDAILPLTPKNGATIAVIGSHAKYTPINGGGSASLDPYYRVSILDGIKRAVGDGVSIHWEMGVFAQKMLPIVDSLISHPENPAGGVIRFYNEPWDGPATTRELICQEPLKDLYFQLMDYNRNPKLNYDLFYATVETDFVPDVSGLWEFGLTVCGTADLYVDNKLVIDNTNNQIAGEAFFRKGKKERVAEISLQAGQSYRLRIEFGSAKTSRLMQVGVVSFGGGGARLGAKPVSDVHEGIRKATEAAARADHVIVCVGLNSDYESDGHDRQHMDLPPNVDELVKRVLEVHPNAVIVNQSGTPVSMPWTSTAKSILQAWYGGNETGNGIADVLFGEVNPSGKLPLTWPVQMEDNPSYGNFGAVSGRVLYGEDIYVGYRHYDLVKKRPLFCFGHGLSYTEFELGQLEIAGNQIRLAVTNTGPRNGATAVQIYISARNSSVPRAPRSLVAFEKVSLEAGTSQLLTTSVDKYATSFWDESESMWRDEVGEYEIQIGFSSRDIRLRGIYRVETSKLWPGL